MSELKPCPFCGEVPTLRRLSIGGNCRVQCDNDECAVNPTTRWYKNADFAVEQWNRRYPNENPKTRQG